MRTISVGTRRSALATTQTGHIVAALRAAHPDVRFETVEIVTQGDRIQDVALSKVGGKGLFISELEEALQSGAIDLAVHSMKDVPAQLASGLMIGAVPHRADPRDLLISREGYTLAELPKGARIGTSSLRRSAQIAKVRPDLLIEPLRGNIDTRLRKLVERVDLSAIVLAAAGLLRMGWWQVESGQQLAGYLLRVYPLSTDEVLPAVGQGALCIECRSDDREVSSLLAVLHDSDAVLCSRAERAFLQSVGGSCQVPVAGYAYVNAAGDITLSGLIGQPDGKQVIAGTRLGKDPVRLGQTLGTDLLAEGGSAILAALTC